MDYFFSFIFSILVKVLCSFRHMLLQLKINVNLYFEFFYRHIFIQKKYFFFKYFYVSLEKGVQIYRPNIGQLWPVFLITY